MLWYSNSGFANASRYVQVFRQKYPFINAQFWSAKSRRVTHRALAEANMGKHLVDVIKPSADLLPVMIASNLIGKYDTPIRAIYPAAAKSPFYTTMNYAFRVFAFNSRKVKHKDAPKSWADLLQAKWKSSILFDESSLEEVMAMLAAWGREKTVNYLSKLRQQNLLIRVGRDTTTQMMMAGEANLAVTTYAYNNERLRNANAPVEWVAEDLIPTLVYPLALARHAPHPYAAALFYDYLLSEEGQHLSAEEGRVAAHPNVEPVYPRMRELKQLVGTPRIQLNNVEQNAMLLNDSVTILDEVVLKRKATDH